MKKLTCLLLSLLIFATPILGYVGYETGTCVIHEDKGLWACYDNESIIGCDDLNKINIRKNRRKYGKNKEYRYEYSYEFYDKANFLPTESPDPKLVWGDSERLEPCRNHECNPELHEETIEIIA